MQDNKTLRIIDNSILFFSFLFLGSLTNSIFVNQVGYYGALFMTLVRFFYTRKNPFIKTGLEWPFVMFLAVEIISTTLSYNTDQAFTNLLKRAFLIPIVYFVTASVWDVKRAKFFLNTYLLFAFISAFIYVINAYDYFIEGLFQITGSGPGLFQYPITTSTLLSFTIIFFFAFLIHEPRNWKYKLVILFALLVSLVAIFATYKRTGWIGLAAGLVFVIILKRKWLYLAPLVVLIIAAFFMEKNYSNIRVFDFDGSKINLEKIVDTGGRANGISQIDNTIYISDYEAGLAYYSVNGPEYILNTPEPVLEFEQVNDSVYSAWLVDTRFMILKKGASSFYQINEFASPGFNEEYKLNNELFYTLDKDSGLTVINAITGKHLYREEFNESYYKADVNDSLLVLRSRENTVRIYNLTDGIPDKVIYENMFDKHIHIHWLDNGIVYLQDDDGFFTINGDKVTRLNGDKADPVLKVKKYGDNYYAVTLSNQFLKLVTNDTDLYIINTGDTGSLTYDFCVTGDKLYTATYKQGRITSIFDPYLRSNFVRLSLWKAGWEMFKDHPLFGVGDIDLQELYKEYKEPYAKEIQGHLHNNYIHILAILGITGFIAVMWILGKIFVMNIKIYNTFKNREFLGSLALGTAGCFVAFLTSGLTEWNFGDHEIITMVWFVTGLNFAVYLRRKTTD